MTFPDPPTGGVFWWWWQNSGVQSRARVLSAATAVLPDVDNFFWGDSAPGDWRLSLTIVAPDQPSFPPPLGSATWSQYQAYRQIERWRLDTNTWVPYSGVSGATSLTPTYLWQSGSRVGPTGAFRWRTLKDATFTPGVSDPTFINWDGAPWNYIWPQDVEEIPLEVGGIRFTARPSVGVSASILEGIDGGSP
jgi:hypothetical protein